jgi:hypothetical protein
VGLARHAGHRQPRRGPRRPRGRGRAARGRRGPGAARRTDHAAVARGVLRRGLRRRRAGGRHRRRRGPPAPRPRRLASVRPGSVVPTPSCTAHGRRRCTPPGPWWTPGRTGHERVGVPGQAPGRGRRDVRGRLDARVVRRLRHAPRGTRSSGSSGTPAAAPSSRRRATCARAGSAPPPSGSTPPARTGPHRGERLPRRHRIALPPEIDQQELFDEWFVPRWAPDVRAASCGDGRAWRRATR